MVLQKSCWKLRKINLYKNKQETGRYGKDEMLHFQVKSNNKKKKDGTHYGGML